MSEGMSNQIKVFDLYSIQKNRWNELNKKLFGLSININTNPFFIKENLENNVNDFWINGTCDVKEKLMSGSLRNKEYMIKNSWRLKYNDISKVVGLSAFFIFDDINEKKVKDEIILDTVNYINDLNEEKRKEIINSGHININDKDLRIQEIRVAYFPLVTALGYFIKNSEHVLRIKAYPNEFMLRKKDGVIKYKDWEYTNGEFKGKKAKKPFKEVNEANYPFLNAILGEEVNENNFSKALDLMPEYNYSSVLYFNFAWFEEVVHNVLKNRKYADPKKRTTINYISLLNRRNSYANLKTKELYSNLIIVKNKIKALETTRTAIWVPVSDYLGDFKFSDTEKIFDAFKTTTSDVAGRTRLILDNLYVEDNILKIDYNGKTYNQYDLILNRIPDFKMDSNLSCISRAPYNYLNDAKRIMFCAKLRGQSVRVKDQIDDLTHEIPARVVFADWKGFNFGDSFVISESFAKSLEREVTQKFVIPKSLQKEYQVGQEITIEDLIKFAKRDRFSSWRDIKITSIHSNEVEVIARVPFGVGDKITNLHGSKGIVSIILPDEKMPYLKNDLSENMKAGPVDIIVPGISVFRRKSTGQVFEAITSALNIPELPLSELKKKYGKQIKKYDENSIFEFKGKEFSAPCGINNFLRLDHDATTKQSFAYLKSNYNFALHAAEMELLNMAARGFYSILNELDIRSLNKHNNSLELIRNVQKTGNIKDEVASNREFKDYMKYLGWDITFSGVLQQDEIDSRWDTLVDILSNEEIDIF